MLTQLNTPGAPGPAIRQTQRNPKIRIRERKKNNVSNIKSTSATSKCKTKHYETRLRKLPISRSCHGWAAMERLDMHTRFVHSVWQKQARTCPFSNFGHNNSKTRQLKETNNQKLPYQPKNTFDAEVDILFPLNQKGNVWMSDSQQMAPMTTETYGFVHAYTTDGLDSFK